MYQLSVFFFTKAAILSSRYVAGSHERPQSDEAHPYYTWHAVCLLPLMEVAKPVRLQNLRLFSGEGFSGHSQPRLANILINLRRISSYFSPAWSESGFSQCKKPAKASCVRFHSFFGREYKLIGCSANGIRHSLQC